MCFTADPQEDEHIQSYQRDISIEVSDKNELTSNNFYKETLLVLGTDSKFANKNLGFFFDPADYIENNLHEESNFPTDIILDSKEKSTAEDILTLEEENPPTAETIGEDWASGIKESFGRYIDQQERERENKLQQEYANSTSRHINVAPLQHLKKRNWDRRV